MPQVAAGVELRIEFADRAVPTRDREGAIAVAGRLAGITLRRAVEPAESRQHSRLVFLRETRLKSPMTRRLSGRTPRQYTFGEIARGAEEEGTKISKQTVHYVFTEGRKPSAEGLAAMERFFGVLPGFCSYTESEALAARLRPIVQQLRLLNRVADAAAHGATRIAARSTEDLGNTEQRESILSALLDTGVLDDLDSQRRDRQH
ncbi:hypothetical protein AB0D13_33440 [Streptomyces sp. NPDC048430]|uniref:hypothetical protein n=1 Tax=Streptomyces sp. NPDC048430 TaxID=3155388 RepID=UPI003424CB89